MDCLIVFLLCVPYPSTLSERETKNREGQEGKCSWVSCFSVEWCNISHKMTHTESKSLCFAPCLMTEYQNSQISCGNTQEESSLSVGQSWQPSKESESMCSCMYYLYWRCSVCWVWWSLCCRGCLWLPLWTGTSAEVSSLTEPRLQKESKN